MVLCVAMDYTAGVWFGSAYIQGGSMSQKNEEKAVSAYIKFLESKQVDADSVAVRAKFVRSLSLLLKGKSGRADFGKALEMISRIADNIDCHQQMNIAREFYPFWTDDIKMIAAMSESYGYDLSTIRFRSLPTKLEWETIAQLSNEKLSDQEDSLLGQYSQNLQEQKMVETTIQEKIRLARIVLLRLRDIPIHNNITYRLAVDATLPLFAVKELKQRFLQVVREFFYIWIEKTGIRPV